MDLKQTILKLIEDQPKKNLKQLTRSAGVNYWPVYEFVRGKKAKTLDVDIAHKLCIHLTGKGWTIEMEGGAE